MEKCRHVYQEFEVDICPDCSEATRRIDWVTEANLRKKWYEEGKHLQSICPVEGGTIRGWWSI